MSAPSNMLVPMRTRRPWLRRALWENAATIVIGAGVLMLMQPLSVTLYGWSFGMTLIGTAMFTIASKLPE